MPPRPEPGGATKRRPVAKRRPAKAAGGSAQRAGAGRARRLALWLGLAAALGLGWGAWHWFGGRSPAAAGAADGLPTLSLADWLGGHAEDWRVGRLKDNPQVLVIEFPGLAEQGAAMNRVAALVEKAGAPRDRVLDDAQLAQLIASAGDNAQTFYQGHDYAGEALARFFNLALQQRQPLQAQEQRLRELLLKAQLLQADGPKFQARGAQALITFTAVQPDQPATAADETVDERRREAVLTHEASHGVFLTRPAYKAHCERFWREVMTEAQRERFRAFLQGLGYDRGNEELMLNEAQAFLMHTPDTRAFNAAAVGLGEPEMAELRRRFWAEMPPGAMGGS